MIEYPSDGLTITGIMQIPKNGRKPFPVIVMNHGFFSRFAFNSGDGTDRAAEFLNRRGYLTISSDYRSWGGSDIGPSLFYSGLVIDVINLLNSIPSIPEADYEMISQEDADMLQKKILESGLNRQQWDRFRNAH